MTSKWEDDRRDGPLDRRVYDLEEKYDTIINRLNTIDITLEGITTLRDQVTGVINFVKFVGWGGLATMGIFLVRYIVKDMVGH